MAESDSKRFYWLRLKKDFFHQHQIKVLKSLPNGRLYALIYLELMAESTSHEGELRYSKLLPYDIVTLAAVIDEDKDNVEQAIKTLVKLELVEILDDGTIFLRDLCKLIGSETGSAIRKREYRQRMGNNEEHPQIEDGTLSQKCLLEKEIRVRDKSIDIDDEEKIIRDRFLESGEDEWIVDRAITILKSFGVEFDQTLLGKTIAICECESIANPEGYIYEMLKQKGVIKCS